eukprot:scaffold4167_cov138-Isochrysis_galbana.AAC.1
MSGRGGGGRARGGDFERASAILTACLLIGSCCEYSPPPLKSPSPPATPRRCSTWTRASTLESWWRSTTRPRRAWCLH